MEGFSVFKSSESLSSVWEKNVVDADSIEQKKEAAKQIEVVLGLTL